MDTSEGNRQRPQSEAWAPAIVLVAVGAIFLLNNLHIIPFHDLFQYWPVALIAVGLFRLVDSTANNERVFGGVLMLLGGGLLAGTLGYYDLSWNTVWPLLLIAAGVLMLGQRLSFNMGVLRGGIPAWAVHEAADGIHETAIFSGGKRRIKGDFKGGKLDCVFGGFDVNLRQATMSGDEAELEINAVFGGAEIKIPEGWEVVMRGAGVFGAYTDDTVHPDRSMFPNPKRLIMKGAAVFGGVVVKN
jgi:hypothetical protein